MIEENAKDQVDLANSQLELQAQLEEYEEIDAEHEQFKFLKLKWEYDEDAANTLYCKEYLANYKGTRDAKLSYNQWLECKKHDALAFYTKYQDLFL